MPGEICNIPAISSMIAPVNSTRNDFVRQIIGNLTTTSNTFSIWVEGQSISKSKNNTLGLGPTDAVWGLFQPGDQITGRVRYHFVIERDLDPGLDGVYGNAGPSGPGADGVIGTLDDPMSGQVPTGNSAYNPSQPIYTYRIVSAEEIR